MAKELSSAGTHNLIEKPLSTDIASGHNLIDHLQGFPPGVKAVVGHHRRFNPYMVAKKILESHRLGDIVAVSGLWTTYKPAQYLNAPTERCAGNTGGVILINMIHEVDLLHHILGPISRVHA